MNKLRVKPLWEIYSVKIFCILVYDLVAMKTDNLFNFSWYWASQKATTCKLCKAYFQSKVQKTFPQLVYTENRLKQVFDLSYSGETDFLTVSKSKLNRFTRGCHFMLNLKCLLLIFILKTIFCSDSFNFTISFIFWEKNEIFVITEIRESR